MNLPEKDFDLRAYVLGSAVPGSRPVEGRWAVERQLLDRSTGTHGTFSGVVLFSQTDDGRLILREEGIMRWPTFTGPASREYLLKAADRSDALDVFFADGRPFHRMSFSPEANVDQHWCDPDTYRVAYSYEGPDAFTYTWDVTGPRKDLLLSSVLKRQD